jgi:radical SAM protein with 4Fe4S-binding SPASM domain
MISGMRIKKDGDLASSAHALSEDEIEKIVNIVDKNIKSAVDEILNGKFDINPKIINGKNESCTFCKYRDICYLRENNKVYINTEEGDSDANRESVESN